MNRRDALASLGAIGIAGVAGCMGIGEGQPQPRLAWIWVQNDREEAYDVDVVVKEDGEPVFSQTFELGTTPETANLKEDNPLEEPGQYVVRAKMDGETRTISIAEHVESDENCVGVRFSLLNNGSVDSWTKSMQQC